MGLPNKLLIVGGVAGGASTAARARRLDESCEIAIFEKGPHASLATCGLPYHVSGVIEDEADLLVAKPERFRDWLNIDVRLGNEVLSIDRQAREVEVKELETGRVYREGYDALVLAPGARPIRPPVPGVDLPGIFQVRSLQDARDMRTWIDERSAKRAVVVGGGYIGLEMAESLAHRGLEVTIVEMADQLLQPLDPDMAALVQQHLRRKGVTVRLSDGVAAFEPIGEGALRVTTQSGQQIPADLVVLAAGVRPETTLAQQAGLELGEMGGIRVNAQMQTNDPQIWAVGDAVEAPHVPGGYQTLVLLAGPASRQGRVAADNIFGRERSFRGVQGSGVVGAFDLQIAGTGCNEKCLQRAKVSDYEAVYVHPNNHVSYYPGARPMHVKLLFRRSDGRVLGAQIVGHEDVPRRIDVIAMAIQMEATVYDLAEAELCYSPQFGAPKDPVNLAGMVAVNVLQGDCTQAPWSQIAKTNALLLDVRTPQEHADQRVDGSPNIPLSELRQRLDELPKDREIWVYCAQGQRAYYAVRALNQSGRRAKNLPGGMQTYAAVRSLD